MHCEKASSGIETKKDCRKTSNPFWGSFYPDGFVRSVYKEAMHSTSTSPPNGSFATCTQERAGYWPSK